MEIKIEFPTGKTLGSRATITTKRWFRLPKVEYFVCIQASPMHVQWMNVLTGKDADMSLNHKLNEHAQAAANRKKFLDHYSDSILNVVESAKILVK